MNGGFRRSPWLKGLISTLSVGILLATAPPAKFSETVEPAIGQTIEVPERLAILQERDSRATRIDPDAGQLEHLLLSG